MSDPCTACGTELEPADYCPLCGKFTAYGISETLAAAEARGAARAAEKLADLESEQASLCDLLNTWAREEGVRQAEQPGEMKSLADRLWGHLSRRVAAAEGRGAALAIEQCRRLAEEVRAAEAPPQSGESANSAFFRSGWRGGLLRLLQILPASFDLAKEAEQQESTAGELLARYRPAPPSVVSAMRAAVEAFPCPDEPDGGDEQMSKMTELNEAFIEEQQPTVSEIRRWIGEARKAGAAELREKIATELSLQGDQYFRDPIVSRELTALAARIRAGEFG